MAADDDIFMDYASPETENTSVSALKFNFPRIRNDFNDILKERKEISLKLKNSFNTPSNSHETRLQILQLRRFNRHVSNSITAHRKQLNELKDIVDNLNSKLLCQKFEKQHLLDEIKSCLNAKYIHY